MGVTVILRLRSQTLLVGEALGIRVGVSILTSDTFTVAGNMPWKNVWKSAAVGWRGAELSVGGVACAVAGGVGLQPVSKRRTAADSREGDASKESHFCG